MNEQPVNTPVVTAAEISAQTVTCTEISGSEWTTHQAKWDWRFLNLAKFVSAWSKDPSTKCGAVIVRFDKTIASTGYNGFPRGCSDADEIYADRDLKLARVVHAELNALLHAREPVTGYTMYVHAAGIGPTCDRCAAHVIQAGILRVVYLHDSEAEAATRWGDSLQRARDMYYEAGVAIQALREEDRPL